MSQLNSRNDAELLAREVIGCLEQAGHEALLVGGCVRDLLLGRTPEDYDVATDARPEQVMQLFPRTVPVGARFGIVLVVGERAQVEVATFRKETGYADHRHPDIIEFSDARHDALRRDFTVNALFMKPAGEELLDFVGGRDDLERRLIRTVGSARSRLQEDALRLVRALRLASSLDFEIEAETWQAIKDCASLIRSISVERVRDELTKGFTRSRPDRFLQLLDSSGLLSQVLPEVAALKGCEQPPEFHPEGDVFVHTCGMLALLPESPSPALAYAILLHDIGKPPTATRTDRIRFNQHEKVGATMADSVCRRLAFPNELRQRVVDMVERHMTYMNLPRMRESTLRRFLAHPHIEEELELHRIDCLGSHGSTDNYTLAHERLKEFRGAEGNPVLPGSFVNGNDLIALGLVPGPLFKVLLDSVHDAQLQGTVGNREEALALLEKLALGE
jgi:poly(A) polymerase